MKHNRLAIFLALSALLLLLAVGAVVLAQSSADFNLSKYVIGSGGGETNSASFRVNSTIGQGMTSLQVPTNANFTVQSGYWLGSYSVFLPAVVSQ